MVVSIKVGIGKAEKIEKAYPNNRPLVPYSRFSSQVDDCVITVYNSLKVVFQGERAEIEASKWDKKIIPNTPVKEKENQPKQRLEKVWAHIGCDEVGTGDFFGPIITVACYVPYESLKELRNMGIDDSKKITDTRIRYLAQKLEPFVKYEYSIITNVDYNKAIKTMNMNSIKAYLHNNSIAKLVGKFETRPLVIMDQFVDRKIYYSYLKEAKNVIKNIWFETKAESKYLGVAAASIIARNIFLNEMEKLSKEVGYDLPLGAGVKIDEMILTMSEETLAKCGKLNFNNYKKTRG